MKRVAGRMIEAVHQLRDSRAGTPAEANSGAGGSLFDEDRILDEVLQDIDVRKVCVDIGASDGRTMSNSLRLYDAGWSGLAAELDPEKFVALAQAHAGNPEVGLARVRVTPANVASLLRGAGVPEDFGVLSLDIDGYDFHVLDALLQAFRPSVICAEINEKIPPPLLFSVRYADDYAWDTGHFYGQSINQVAVLCERYGYSIARLEYNNVFLVVNAVATVSLTAEAAYAAGYADRADRHDKMPWNADMEPLQSLAPAEAVAFLRERFAAYDGRYELSIDDRSSLSPRASS
jgi:hypothetical protein